MRRALRGGLAALTAVGAGALLAPGAWAARAPENGPGCGVDGQVVVSYDIADDPRWVDGVALDGLHADCRLAYVRVGLYDGAGTELAITVERQLRTAGTLQLAFDRPVAAEPVARVDVVVSGAPSDG